MNGWLNENMVWNAAITRFSWIFSRESVRFQDAQLAVWLAAWPLITTMRLVQFGDCSADPTIS